MGSIIGPVFSRCFCGLLNIRKPIPLKPDSWDLMSWTSQHRCFHVFICVPCQLRPCRNPHSHLDRLDVSSFYVHNPKHVIDRHTNLAVTPPGLSPPAERPQRKGTAGSSWCVQVERHKPHLRLRPPDQPVIRQPRLEAIINDWRRQNDESWMVNDKVNLIGC